MDWSSRITIFQHLQIPYNVAIPHTSDEQPPDTTPPTRAMPSPDLGSATCMHKGSPINFVRGDLRDVTCRAGMPYHQQQTLFLWTPPFLIDLPDDPLSAVTGIREINFMKKKFVIKRQCEMRK